MRVEDQKFPIQQFAAIAEELGDKIYWRQPINRQYRETSWREAYDKTLRLAAGFKSLGLQAGDKVAIYSENCDEWFLTDFAITAAGLISVPIYFTAGKKTVSYVLEHSEAKAIVVGKLGEFAHLDEAVPDDVITLSMSFDVWPCQHNIQDLIAQSEPIKEVPQPGLDDVFSIAYTSGSTGNPKGVVLTFRNIIFGGNAIGTVVDAEPDERLLSYLPLAHITERAIIEYCSLYFGATVSFVESLETFLEDLKNADVTSFLSVPRLWLKFQAGILSKMPQKRLDLLLKIPVINNIVKRKIQSQLGLSRSKLNGSGSAPIAPAIVEWYEKVGINISEGWGMTEVSGMATTLFPFRKDKIGTIGKPVEGFDIKICDQGEIWVKGDGVFKEYYKNPEVTAETFSEDGWMRTGDRGAYDDDGYLRITGRVKDVFKSAKGKYVAPVPIEGLLYENQLIEQVCVMGTGLPAPKAVVVLSPDNAKELSKEEIKASFEETLERVNAQLEKHERLAGICIVEEEWTIDNGLLTPTLKIKRDKLEEKYRELVAENQAERVLI